jgi:hypothetical protein
VLKKGTSFSSRKRGQHILKNLKKKLKRRTYWIFLFQLFLSICEQTWELFELSLSPTEKVISNFALIKLAERTLEQTVKVDGENSLENGEREYW